MIKNRKIIKIDEDLCDGCGLCVPACEEGSIRVVGGKAKLIGENLCDGLGACLGECPKGALSIEEREAEVFDEEAVAAYLDSSACRGSNVQSFIPEISSRPAGAADRCENRDTSNLSHWPVQINLVPPGAPFLHDAHLLVTADCVPIAYPSFHRDFLHGKVILLGCPKFDNKSEYLKKFVDIFSKARIRSVTVIDMEVPCCSSLPGIVKRAIAETGVSVPMSEVTISTRGSILPRR
jgi:NAD-dependent dihydropyrimidine dehydrogenase PreA subunit